MCEQCCAKTLNWDTGLDFSLVLARQDGYEMKKDQWGLVFINDPEIIWDIKPIKDPCWGLSDEEMDKLPPNIDEDFYIGLNNFRDNAYFTATMAHKLVENSLKKGYISKNDIFLEGHNFEHWLFHYLGKVLEEVEPQDDFAEQRMVD